MHSTTYPLFLSASLLSANFAALGLDAKKVLEAGVDSLHIDIMDNHYVPNLSMGPMIIKALREEGIQAPIDTHLMVQPVDDIIKECAKNGSTSISFHPEASLHVDRSISLIHDYGCKAGLALNPTTSPEVLKYILDKLDFILIMSVNPGFSGQQFIPSTFKKIKAIQTLCLEAQQVIPLAIDGGIQASNIKPLAQAGIHTFVAGSAIFAQTNYYENIQKLRAQMDF